MPDEDASSSKSDPGERRARGLWAAFLILWGTGQIVYGSAAPWASAATAAGLGGLFLTARWLLPRPLLLSRAARLWMLGTAVLVLLQILPLPFLFPHATRQRLDHGVGTLWPGTADVFLTIRSFCQVSAYVLTALLILKLRQAGLRSGTVLRGLSGILLLQALYALAQVAFEFRDIPFYGPRAGNVASGTLVNRNNFAGLMAMGLAAVTGLALRQLRYAPRLPDRSFGWSRRLEAGLLWGLAAGILVAALVLSQSRGGAIAALTAAAAIPFLWRGRASAAGLLALVLVGAAFMVVAAPEALVERFRALDPFEIQRDLRMELWKTTAAAAAHQPVFGFGWGTHPSAYHPFQPVTIAGQVHHAHNEYVNLFFEGGVAWLALLLWGLGVWTWKVWRGLDPLPGPDRIAPVAALSAVMAEVIHSLVDFDLRIPSVGMFFAAMVGLGTSKLRRGTPFRPEWLPPAAALAAAGALAFLPLDPAILIHGVPSTDAAQSELRLARAAGLSPYDHRVAWMRALTARRRGDRQETDRRFLLAADLWPAHPDLQHEAGFWFWEAYEEGGDPLQRQRAARCFGRLFLQNPGELVPVMNEIWDPERPIPEYESLLPAGAPEPAAQLAGFLARKGRWQEGMALFEKACAGSPRAHDLFAAALQDMGQWGLEATVREKRLAIRSDAAAYAACARAWLRLGELSRALDRAGTAARIEPGNAAWHGLRAEVLRAKGEDWAAAEAYTEAIRRAPMDLSYRLARGRTYAKLGLLDQAADDFREVLKSRPDDRGAVLDLARALLGLRSPSGARRVLEAYLWRHPEDAEIRRLQESIRD